MGRISGINFCMCVFVCPQSVIDGLKALGHKAGNWRYFFNVVNAVEKENGCIVAISDSRKAGLSAGY